MTVIIRDGKIYFYNEILYFIFKYMCDTMLRVNTSIRYKIKSPNIKRIILLEVIKTDFFKLYWSIIDTGRFIHIYYILINEFRFCIYPNAITTFQVLNPAVISKNSLVFFYACVCFVVKKWFLKITTTY